MKRVQIDTPYCTTYTVQCSTAYIHSLNSYFSSNWQCQKVPLTIPDTEKCPWLITQLCVIVRFDLTQTFMYCNCYVGVLEKLVINAEKDCFEMEVYIKSQDRLKLIAKSARKFPKLKLWGSDSFVHYQPWCELFSYETNLK